eukprot:UN12883
MWKQQPFFVAITSFDDARCGSTLVNLFKRALFPERVTVAITSYGPSCIDLMCKMIGEKECDMWKSQIYIVEKRTRTCRSRYWIPDNKSIIGRTGILLANSCSRRLCERMGR